MAASAASTRPPSTRRTSDYLPGSPSQSHREYSTRQESCFVGSPEQVHNLGRVYNSTLNSLSQSNIRAPAGSHALRRNSRGVVRPSVRDREWSLFTQLMEDEGQLSRPGNRRSSQAVNRSPSTHRDEPPPVNEQLTPPKTPEGTERESDYESDSSDSSSTCSVDSSLEGDHNSPSWIKTWYNRIPTIPPLYRNIFKCSLAYFIGSLFTFNPFLAGLISDITSYDDGKPLPTGHMVATIAVYFHPAKTLGSMVEADFFCLAGLAYGFVVCIGSMSLFWWLEEKKGFELAGDITAIVIVAISMSAVAWMKVWMANPSFGTACSMTAIIIFTVIAKEGGLATFVQTAIIISFGAIVSNLVCVLVFPQSATNNLKTSMTKTLDSFSTLLTMLTETFLLERGEHTACHDKVQRAVDVHQSTFTSLKKCISEARGEWIWRGNEPIGLSAKSKPWGSAYEDAVESMTRLAQHINGLRSGTRLQTELSRAGIRNFAGKKTTAKGKKPANYVESTPVIDDPFDEEAAILKSANAMFGELVEELGPPLKALTSSCTTCLRRLRESWVQSRIRARRHTPMNPEEFLELSDSIERALLRFDSTSNHAVLRAYRRSDFQERASSIYSQGGQGDSNEHIFLVYFFIFTLQEFVRELVSLNDAMSRVYHIEQAWVNRPSVWSRFWKSIRDIPRKIWDMNPKLRRGRDESRQRQRLSLRRSISNYWVPQRKRKTKPRFPKIKPHAPNTLLTPSSTNFTYVGKIKQKLWAFGTRLVERDMKYAIKAGMAVAILAAPSFFEQTRPIFEDYWGQWALISFFVVLSPTIGATNLLSVYRVLGTLFGAGVAAGMYSLFPDNGVVLAIFGFFFSIPCFYYTVATPQYATASRFVLLTYNLTCLYSYNIREGDVEVTHIATHRAIAVTAGVVWAALVSRFWWPSEARRELTKALGEFCLNIGWLYTKLVASNSYMPELEETTELGSSSTISEVIPLLKPETQLDNSIKEFMSMELHLQIKLIELQGLLAQTVHEPRLKGPFPVELYRTVLLRLQTILDKLHSMRCVTTREEWYTSVRRDFILPVNRERKEMVGNIILSFSVLSSAFLLKAPLPPYLPPSAAERARQRLVNAIRELNIVKNREVRGSRQLLFFAYALNLRGVTGELEALGRLCQEAFGTIGQTTEQFDALFVTPDDSQRFISSVV